MAADLEQKEAKLEGTSLQDAPADKCGFESEEWEPYCFKLYNCLKNTISKDVRSECKSIFTLSWPVSVSNVLLFFIPVSTLMLLGHTGKDSLAGVGLALALNTLTGTVLVSGFSSACITLASPAHGARNTRLVGIILQRTFALCIILIFPLLAIWVNAEKIFLGLHQEHAVARIAQDFLLFYIPALLFQTVYTVFQKFLASQKIVLPFIYGGIGAIIINIILSCIFIYVANFGLRGGAIAAGLAWCFNSGFLLVYVLCSGVLSNTWPGFSLGWLLNWGQFFTLAIPSTCITLLEVAAFQYGTFLMGTLSELDLDVHIAAYYIALLIYTNSHGITTAASVKVGNLLGTGEVKLLRCTVKAVLLDVGFITVLIAILLFILKDVIGYLFSGHEDVIEACSSVIPVLALFVVLDGIQAVCGGILQGSGLQKFGAVVNLFGYVLVAIPAGSLLSVVAKMGVQGYWFGLTCGAFVQVLIYGFLLWKVDFKERSVKARKRAGIFDEEVLDEGERSINECTEMQAIDFGVETDTEQVLERDEFLAADTVSVTVNSCIVIKRITLVTCAVSVLLLSIILKYVTT